MLGDDFTAAFMAAHNEKDPEEKVTGMMKIARITGISCAPTHCHYGNIPITDQKLSEGDHVWRLVCGGSGLLETHASDLPVRLRS